MIPLRSHHSQPDHKATPELITSIANTITKNQLRWNYRHEYKPDPLTRRIITHIRS